MSLLVIPVVVLAVGLVRRHHLDVATVTLLATLALGLPMLWLAWAGYRDARRSAAVLTLPQIADQLAGAVEDQWEAEVRLRRLNEPYPLPVRWTAADPFLSDDWDLLVRLASGGAGWPAPPPPGTWAAGPEGLAGGGRALVEVLAKVPTGRLVVLGEPGAGKTMLMVRFVLDLLVRRASGEPVPVLVSVASWNPADPGQDLRGWLAGQLAISYPALATPPPVGRGEPTRGAALLAAGLIVPVLDGLDEIPAEVRGLAVSKISDMLVPGGQLVVTCRSEQYREVVSPEDGPGGNLVGAAAVQLLPLLTDDVRGYLRDDAAGPAAKARWDPVLKLLGTGAPAGQALRTPLMVTLARAIYNPPPDELGEDMPDPAELCNPELADRAAVEYRLFDAFIASAYRGAVSGRWTAQDARKWLIFLAGHLDRAVGSPDLAWWQLREHWGQGNAPVTGPSHGVRMGFDPDIGGDVGGQAGLWVGIAAGIVNGVSGGVVKGIVAAVVYGLVAGVVGGLAAGVVGGLLAAPADQVAAASPRVVLAHDRRTALQMVLVSCAIGGVVGAVTAMIADRLAGAHVKLAGGHMGYVHDLFHLLTGFYAWTSVVDLVQFVARLGLPAVVGVGLAAGLITGIVYAMIRTAWPSYTLTRWLLALAGQQPWALMGFLADAHRRGVMRQVGAVYQFRHIELQHRLATQAVESLRYRD